MRTPIPRSVRSSTRPAACANFALPSARNSTLSPLLVASRQAPITKTSLTEVTATVSTPLAFNSS